MSDTEQIMPDGSIINHEPEPLHKPSDVDLGKENAELKADIKELAACFKGWIDNYESQYGESDFSVEQKALANKHLKDK